MKSNRLIGGILGLHTHRQVTEKVAVRKKCTVLKQHILKQISCVYFDRILVILSYNLVFILALKTNIQKQLIIFVESKKKSSWSGRFSSDLYHIYTMGCSSQSYFLKKKIWSYIFVEYSFSVEDLWKLHWNASTVIVLLVVFHRNANF